MVQLYSNPNDPHRGRNLPRRHFNPNKFESEKDRARREANVRRLLRNDRRAFTDRGAKVIELWFYVRSLSKARRNHKRRPFIPQHILRRAERLCIVA